MNNDSTNDYELDISRYKIILKLETGGYGTVYKVEEISTGKYFAAKVINCNGNKAECHKMTNNEILILEKVNHPTIIKFIGYSKKDFQGNDNITLMLELQKQSLLEVLRDCRFGLAETRFTNTERQIILVGIARGMKYLHAHNIIHRDLKPGNILLNKDYYPFITDFGMSKICKFGHSQSQSLYAGTIQYDAPEILKAEKYNRKVDVYAFGILMFEVVTQRVAYSNISNQFELMQKVQNGYRPDFRDIKINENIKNLIIKCWSDDPKARPEFSEIFNKLAYKISDNDDENFFLDGVDVDCLDDYVSEIIEADDLVENQHEIIISQKQQIEKLQSEIRLLNDQLSQSKNKIELLKDKIIDNEHVFIDNKNMMIENIQLKNENQLLKNNKQELDDENSKQKEKIEQITNENNQLKSDINDLTNESNKIKAYNEKLIIDNTQLASDKDILTNKNSEQKATIKQLTNDNSEQKIKIEQLTTENIQIRNYNEKLIKEKIEQEITIKQKINENNQMKLNNQRIIKQNKLLKIRNQKIAKELNQIKDSNQILTNENIEHIAKIEQITSENDQLKNDKEVLTNENIDQKAKIEQIISDNSKLKNDNDEQKTKIEQITIENDKLINENAKQKEKIKQVTTENDQIKSENQQLINENAEQKEKIEKMTNENSQIITQNQILTNDLSKSVEKVSEMKLLNEKKDEKINKYLKRIRYQSKLIDNSKSINESIKNMKKNEITIDEFNNLPLQFQHFIISLIISNGNGNVFFNHLLNLIYYIYRFLPKDNKKCIEIQTKDNSQQLKKFNEKSKYQILISPTTTNLFYQNNQKFRAEKFIEIMNTFSDFSIEILTPSDNFNDVFNFVKSIRKKYNFKISSFISNIKETNENLCNYLSINCLHFDSYLISIGNNSFSRCQSLTKIIFNNPSSLKFIGDFAFANCSLLNEVIIPSTVEFIGKMAFSGCESLLRIEIPLSVIEIKESAFHGCSSLKEVNIPSSVISIGNSAFSKCSSLSKFSIHSKFPLDKIGIDSNVTILYLK